LQHVSADGFEISIVLAGNMVATGHNIFLKINATAQDKRLM
jgi:hypothetical protein